MRVKNQNDSTTVLSAVSFRLLATNISKLKQARGNHAGIYQVGENLVINYTG